MFLAQNIRLIREVEGLSQDEFGKKINLKGDNIYTYESKGVMPKQISLRRISEVFNVPIDTLLNVELTEVSYKKIKQQGETDIWKDVLKEDQPSYSQSDKKNKGEGISVADTDIKSLIESTRKLSDSSLLNAQSIADLVTTNKMYAKNIDRLMNMLEAIDPNFPPTGTRGTQDLNSQRKTGG